MQFILPCKKSFQLIAEGQRGKKNTFSHVVLDFSLFPFHYHSHLITPCTCVFPLHSPHSSLLHPFWVSSSICFLLQPHFCAYWFLCPCPNFFSRLNSFPFLAIFLLTQSKLPLHLPRALFLPKSKYNNCAMKVFANSQTLEDAENCCVSWCVPQHLHSLWWPKYGCQCRPYRHWVACIPKTSLSIKGQMQHLSRFM